MLEFFIFFIHICKFHKVIKILRHTAHITLNIYSIIYYHININIQLYIYCMYNAIGMYCFNKPLYSLVYGLFQMVLKNGDSTINQTLNKNIFSIINEIYKTRLQLVIYK